MKQYKVTTLISGNFQIPMLAGTFGFERMIPFESSEGAEDAPVVSF